MSPTDDPRWAAIGRQTERTSERLNKHDEWLTQLATDVTTLVARQKPGQAEVPVSWLAGGLTTEAAQALLRDLAAWLHRVYLRYPGTQLPSCWLWHPSVVEELVWLRGAHRTAYDPDEGSWQRVADWHDRQRPGVVERVKQYAGDCELSRHSPDGDCALPAHPAPLATPADLDHIAHTWATDPDKPVAPTTEQLNRSATHDSARHH
jgi:hypothetical protein